MKRLDPLFGLVEDLPPRTRTVRLLSSQAVLVRFPSVVDAPFRVGPREVLADHSRLDRGPCAPISPVRAYPAAAPTSRNGSPGVIKNDVRTYGSAVTSGEPTYGGAA